MKTIKTVIFSIPALFLCFTLMPALARAEVSLDPTFGTGGKAVLDSGGEESHSTAVAIQADGKIIVAGSTQSASPGLGRPFLVRLKANGAPDETFGSSGYATFPSNRTIVAIRAILVQPDGRIVAADGFAVMRYLPDGTLDSSFGQNGVVRLPTVAIPPDRRGGMTPRALAIQSDDKIVVVAELFTGTETVEGVHVGTYQFAAVRLNPDGSLDSSFDDDGWMSFGFGFPSDSPWDVAIQPDNKIVIVGREGELESSAKVSSGFAMARLMSDGTLDDSFGVNGRVWGDEFPKLSTAWSTALGRDGEIFVCSRIGLLAFDPSDGSLDASLGESGILTDGGCFSVHVQTDGKILAFDDRHGSLQRFDAAGNPDPDLPETLNLNEALSESARIWDFFLLPDDKVLVVGQTETEDLLLARLILTPDAAPSPTRSAPSSPQVELVNSGGCSLVR